MLKFDASKYECRISDLWIFDYLNLLSNLLCGGGATMLYFFQPLLLEYMVWLTDLKFFFLCTCLHVEF